MYDIIQRKTYPYLILLLLLCSTSLSLTGQELATMFNAKGYAISYVKGELLVRLTEGAEIEQLREEVDLPIVASEQLSKLMNIWLVKFADNDVQSYLDQCYRSRYIVAAQLNHKLSERATTPNDPSFSNQWGLSQIDAEDAWDNGTGASGTTVNGDEIVIAVIDSGFDLNHNDLNFWSNTGEIDNNGVDDDGNGYVDDVNGWNVFNGTDNITSSTHGTHVAGIAAARGNNNNAISGVSWNTRVMAVQGSSGVEATVVAAYDYVLSNRVLFNTSNGTQGTYVVATNASFGVDFADPANFPLWCGIYDDLGAAGILNTGATINANVNVDVQGDVPTGCTSDFLISVTNTNTSDNISSAGRGVVSIDLGAPGTAILSTIPGNGTSNLSGTSMATPHVTGAIALLYSIACENFINNSYTNPQQAAFDICTYIFDGADQPASLNGLVGIGRLNLNGAVQELLNAEICTACPFSLNLTSPVNQSQDFEAEDHIHASNFVNGFATVVYQAGDEVRLLPGFSVGAQGSGSFHALIEDCEGMRPVATGEATVADSRGATTAQESSRSSLSTPANVGKVAVYPNPIQDHFTIELEGNFSYELYHLLGERTAKSSANEKNVARVNVADLPAGVYLLKLTTRKGSFTRKLVKN